MTFYDLFYASVTNALENGSIGFGEPDLTKIFVNLLSLSFRRTGVTSKAKLTQSQAKWFASRNKNGPAKEIGDFILFSKKNNQFKVAFIQAKSIKKVGQSLDSGQGNVYQHWLMSGKAKQIYLMKVTPFTFFADPKSKKSISNYLVFYREQDKKSGVYKYEAYLSSVKAGVKLCKSSQKTFRDFDKNSRNKKIYNKSITFGRKYHNHHLKDDCICATSFRSIINEIAQFRVGEPVGLKLINVLRPYISKNVARILETGEWPNVIQDEDEKAMPVIIVDTDSFDPEIILEDPFATHE